MYAEIKKICRKAYQEYVQNAPIHPELKRALAAHERVPTFVDNLAREFGRANQLKLTREEIEAATMSMTRIFIQNVEKQSEERRLSDVERMRRVMEEQTKKDMQQLADTMADGGTEHVERTARGEISRASVEISD